MIGFGQSLATGGKSGEQKLKIMPRLPDMWSCHLSRQWGRAGRKKMSSLLNMVTLKK